MNTLEISLKELDALQSTLTHTLIQIRIQNRLPESLGLLMNFGGYVANHIHRLRDWGARPEIDDLDLIGYSTRCIFEANLMLEYYASHQPHEMYDLVRHEIDRDEFDLLESVVAFHDSPTLETQPIFDDHARRKQSKHPRTPNFQRLAEMTGTLDEYKSFYKLYSKYAHPSAYLLMADRREVWSSYAREIFLDRAVLYAQHCATVMDIILRKSIDASAPEG